MHRAVYVDICPCKFNRGTGYYNSLADERLFGFGIRHKREQYHAGARAAWKPLDVYRDLFHDDVDDRRRIGERDGRLASRQRVHDIWTLGTYDTRRKNDEV